jgi:hypothetical protein
MRRELEQIEIPDELGARRRTWQTVRGAFLDRDRVTWPRRHARALVVVAACAALAAAALTPPGRSVVNSIRDAVGREKIVGVRNAHRELVRLPAPGRLLLDSTLGPWIVQEGGSRRLLGPYRMASWSPHGLFVAAVRDFELLALDPKGHIRWTIGRKQQLAYPRWSFDGFRIGYLSDRSLRVVIGDGSRDWGLGSADPRVAPAWRPLTHQVAWIGSGGDLRVADADARRLLWRVPQAEQGSSLEWSSDGRQLLVRGRRHLSVYLANGRRWTEIPIGDGVAFSAAAFRPRTHQFAYAALLPGRHSRVFLFAGGSHQLFSGASTFRDLAWSPDGSWLLVAWPSADEFVFLRAQSPPRLVAVANVAEQFNPGVRLAAFPRLDGWCCTPQ